MAGGAAHDDAARLWEGEVRLRGLRTLMIVMGVLTVLVPLPTVLAPGLSPAETAVGYGPVVLLGVWMVVRVSRCGLEDTGDHLIVRNPLRTVRIPWPDVRGVELGRFGVMPKVGIRRADGSAVGVFGLPIAASAQDADASTLDLMERIRQKAAVRGVSRG